uniref:hypothetical protein n=1 Tax=Mesorhizobium sp. LHD-90 TaxID=3071414 RepID=UPI0035A96D3A
MALSLSGVPALALSEIKREELPAPSTQQPQGDDTEKTVPLPEATSPSTTEQPDETTPADSDDTTEPAGQARPDPDEPAPEVLYDVSQLPPDVQKLRNQMLEVAKSGDIEKLRPLLGMGDDMTQLSLIAVEGDPIDYLKSLAGDEDGQEILAILEEVLSAGYVHLDAGKPEELYVWPYFFAVPLDKLTGPQRVELFKIVTAGDYEEMKNFGSYIFYRVGITPQGRWAFFVAGE